MSETRSFHALRFNRSAPRYESLANVQSHMAGKLLELSSGLNPETVLEFGCGTGILTRLLSQRFPAAAILATDASPEMLKQAQRHPSARIQFAEQDAGGKAPACSAIHSGRPYDLLASNALVQWFPRLEDHFGFAALCVKPGGAYLVSGFTSSNFPELNTLLSEPPFAYRSFPGHTQESIRQAATVSGWKVADFQDWKEKEILPSALEVLRRIQTLGSTRDPREGGALNRHTLEHLRIEYERRFGEMEGVSLTWTPWIALLQAN